MTPIASVKRDEDDDKEGTGKPAKEEPEASEEPPADDTPEDGG